MINSNPFSVNRAEYMKNLWKYYVPFNDFQDNIDKSVVVVGGRGTGKSMYFLCNGWREKYAKLEASSETPIQDFLNQTQIGIYYKVDSAFVGSMNSLIQDNRIWQGYFNTYLAVSLIVDLLPLIGLLYKNNIIAQLDINKIISIYYKKVRGKDVEFEELELVKRDCSFVLQEIEDLINGMPISEAHIRASQPGTILKAIVDKLHSVQSLSKMVFKVYIDEYESFSEWQQIIINTLIKQSNQVLIYNISMRHNGMKTNSTLGENEILQSTHDYRSINFDELLSGKDYANCLKDICKKRFEMFFIEKNLINTKLSTDIEYYLTMYDSSFELQRFDGRKLNFKRALENIIRNQCDEKDKTDKMIEVLCLKAPLLNARLHLALLLRAAQFRPKISDLYKAYVEWQKNSSHGLAKKYQEWLHNAKNGLIYLLAKDSGLSKWYYGFDTFAMLSSGVVRYFLELCEQAFNIATIEGFSWNDPKPITPEVQTRAAKYVSQYKVDEIASYPLCGKRLRIFVQYLGEIYRDLHRNDNSTLGEPEVNHFTTESLQLSQDVEAYLNDAITWLVLQKLPQTKSKENLRTNILDYHLNKIYTPYFEISFNKKRKIKLDIHQLRQLFSSDTDCARKAARDFLVKYWKQKSKINQFIEKETVEEIYLFEDNTDED